MLCPYQSVADRKNPAPKIICITDLAVIWQMEFLEFWVEDQNPAPKIICITDLAVIWQMEFLEFWVEDR
jgi:hypothetical protein